MIGHKLDIGCTGPWTLQICIKELGWIDSFDFHLQAFMSQLVIKAASERVRMKHTKGNAPRYWPIVLAWYFNLFAKLIDHSAYLDRQTAGYRGKDGAQRSLAVSSLTCHMAFSLQPFRPPAAFSWGRQKATVWIAEHSVLGFSNKWYWLCLANYQYVCIYLELITMELLKLTQCCRLINILWGEKSSKGKIMYCADWDSEVL